MATVREWAAMTIRNHFADVLLPLAGAGLLFLAAFMMIAPFLVSLIANFGRREVVIANRHANRRRMLTAPRAHSPVS
jgi:hypothetical protein